MGLMGKMGSGGSRGRSTFSHLYSPKVQSSSFMGWNSGSVCASSFSLTSEKRGSNLDKPLLNTHSFHCPHAHSCSLNCIFIYECVCGVVPLLTRVFPSLIPLDEADNEEDQDEQSDGTHEANEPSLSGDVHLSARHGWPEEERKT